MPENDGLQILQQHQQEGLSAAANVRKSGTSKSGLTLGRVAQSVMNEIPVDGGTATEESTAVPDARDMSYKDAIDLVTNRVFGMPLFGAVDARKANARVEKRAEQKHQLDIAAVAEGVQLREMGKDGAMLLTSPDIGVDNVRAFLDKHKGLLGNTSIVDAGADQNGTPLYSLNIPDMKYTSKPMNLNEVIDYATTNMNPAYKIAMLESTLQAKLQKQADQQFVERMTGKSTRDIMLLDPKHMTPMERVQFHIAQGASRTEAFRIEGVDLPAAGESKEEKDQKEYAKVIGDAIGYAPQSNEYPGAPVNETDLFNKKQQYEVLLGLYDKLSGSYIDKASAALAMWNTGENEANDLANVEDEQRKAKGKEFMTPRVRQMYEMKIIRTIVSSELERRKKSGELNASMYKPEISDGADFRKYLNDPNEVVTKQPAKESHKKDSGSKPSSSKSSKKEQEYKSASGKEIHGKRPFDVGLPNIPSYTEAVRGVVENVLHK